MVDRETVLARAARIHEKVALLEAMPQSSPEEFAANPDLYLKAERCLEVMAQAMLDIGAHIIAERGLPKPARYADVFRILGESGILNVSLAGRLEKLAGLRNLLVHEYLAIDRARLHEFISTRLVDVKHFLEVILTLARDVSR